MLRRATPLMPALALIFLASVPPTTAQEVRDTTAAATPLQVGQLVERAIDAREVHGYTLVLPKGTFLHAVVEQIGANLSVAAYGPEGDTLIEADSLVYDGPEALLIEATRPGTHRLEVRWVWGAQGRYTLRVETRTAAEQEAFLARERATAEAARTWMRERAIPLATVEAEHGFADLEPLRPIVGDARIVALGEATHGSREFFQLKHRMLEFLVSELGFDIFAMEATLPEAMDVNRYVLTGQGDPARALAGMYFWVWDTEEVLELIRWMRRYNEDPRHQRMVKFYGFDMQFMPRAARITLDYLRRVDTAAAPAALEPLADPFLARDVSSRWPRERRQALLASIRELAVQMDERQDEYAARTSAGEWDLARRHVHVLQQALEMMTAARGGLVRDSAMAANVAWMLEREGPGSKAVLWAHNLHIATQPGLLGWHLRRRFGDGLRVFGFSFDQGGFQARDAMVDGTLRAWQVGPAPEGTVDAQLAAAGLGIAAWDLREVPDTGLVASWFDAPRATRSVGSGYTDRTPEWYWWRGRVADAYDVLLFVGETHTARANPTGTRPAMFQPPAPAPVNTNFEDGEPGEWPPGWRGPTGIARVEWDVALTREDARRGAQAVVINRKADGGYGETHAELRQTIDASQWRGQRVTLRASVRVEATTPASRAYVWLEVTAPRRPGRGRGFYDNMADRPITAPDWREYQITAAVPEDANTVSFGFVFVGAGRAWLDEVSLETTRD